VAINKEELLNELNRRFPDAIVMVEEPYGLLTLETNRDVIVDMVKFLRDHPVFQFIFLTDLCAVHYPNDKNREIAVVYLLHSWPNNFYLRIKVFLSEADPVMPTMTGVFKCTNWLERETYDNMGVTFAGHPDLRRILNMEDMDYFPLRKEYPLEDQIRQDKVDMMFGR
jgi:NADH-quinone oxidoreductase subunit C